MKLLVSVRNLAEALVAAKCGVDVIDIKEPERGALGEASSKIIRRIARQLPNATVSVACGELLDADTVSALPGISYAKIGLAGCRTHDWQATWDHWADSLPIHVVPVLVYYSDYHRCDAPDLQTVFEQALRSRAKVMLIDTYFKDGSCSLDHMTTGTMRSWISRFRECGITIALAGSITREHLQAVSYVAPDLIAVRGAVCRLGNRQGSICEQRIRQWREAMQFVSSDSTTDKAAALD